MSYSTSLVNFPRQIFAAATATVIFPLLAAFFARENHRAVARRTDIGLRLGNFIAMCALAFLSYPIIHTLFDRGSFRHLATVLTASFLQYTTLGLIALAANVVMTR